MNLLWCLLVCSILVVNVTDAISAYWMPILPQVCSPNVPKNVSHALLACDRLMDKQVRFCCCFPLEVFLTIELNIEQLSSIFDSCVRNVNRIPNDQKLDKPKLCYYSRQGMQLDRCKMMRYRAEGITLLQLVEREQDHTVMQLHNLPFG